MNFKHYSLLVATAVLFATSSCSGETSEQGTDDVVGMTFADAEGHLPEDAVYLLQDASPRVGLEPSYTEDQFGSSRWVIVAACSDSDNLLSAETVELALIPFGAFESVAMDDSWSDRFQDAVTCSGLDSTH